jgi:hypothetical protein
LDLQARKPWSCEVFGCDCQNMMDYYGANSWKDATGAAKQTRDPSFFEPLLMLNRLGTNIGNAEQKRDKCVFPCRLAPRLRVRSHRGAGVVGTNRPPPASRHGGWLRRRHKDQRQLLRWRRVHRWFESLRDASLQSVNGERCGKRPPPPPLFGSIRAILSHFLP